ncbi:hypothetical protein GOV03_00385 [Candidatus Woesearchaeota archaeon]|nr:hypothetical protein [Candidatus Woesearchaeota archaeon]
MGKIAKSIVTSLCALIMASGSLAAENKSNVSYIGHCDGFTLQSSDSSGDVECTLRYNVDKPARLTCLGDEIKPEDDSYGEGTYKDVLEDLKFSQYKALWTKEKPALCD